MAKRAVTEFLYPGLLMFLLYLVEVHIAVGSIKFDVILFKTFFVLDKALVKPLLDASFANRFVGYVI